VRAAAAAVRTVREAKRFPDHDEVEDQRVDDERGELHPLPGHAAHLRPDLEPPPAWEIGGSELRETPPEEGPRLAGNARL
jgi:hypothetical protein